MADYYEILGVARTASAAEIRQVYLKLARERHPDRFSDPAEKEKAQEFFKDLTSAFNTLFNEKSRREYDASLVKPRAAPPEEIAKSAYLQGLKLVEDKAYFDAIEMFRSAVENAPTVGRYHQALGNALARNPHWVREAMQSLEKAAQLEPRNPGPLADLARLLLSQGLKLRARRPAEAALKLAPQDAALQELAREAGVGEPAAEAPPDPGGGGLRGLLRRKP